MVNIFFISGINIQKQKTQKIENSDDNLPLPVLRIKKVSFYTLEKITKNILFLFFGVLPKCCVYILFKFIFHSKNNVTPYF